jgi:hypothetical protein
MALSLVYYLRSVSCHPSQIGVGTSVSTFSYLIGCLCLARLVSAMKPRYAVALALVGMGLPCCCLSAPPVMGGISRIGVVWRVHEYALAFHRGLVLPRKRREALNKASTASTSWSLPPGVDVVRRPVGGSLRDACVLVGIAMLFGLAAYVSLFAHFVPACAPFPVRMSPDRRRSRRTTARRCGFFAGQDRSGVHRHERRAEHFSSVRPG